MSITDGRIDNVIGEFAKHSTVSCLNLSSNGLIKIGIGERPLSNLFNLSVMDLSNNNLREVPNLPKNGNITLDVSSNFANTPQNKIINNVYISDNQNMTCSNLSNTLKKPDVHFKNQNSTFCKSHQINFDWFNTFESVPLVQLIQVQKVPKTHKYFINKQAFYSLGAKGVLQKLLMHTESPSNPAGKRARVHVRSDLFWGV